MLKDLLIKIADNLDKKGLHNFSDEVDKISQIYAADKPAMHIAVSDFAKSRHTKDSRYSYFDGSWEQLVQLVEANFSKAKPGYRDGVVLVPVPANGFYSNTVQMSEGMELVGKYVPRRPGEKPYIQWTPSGAAKMPAKNVDIVLYRHDVLVEGDEASADSEWEIISINASPWEMKEGESEPMHPETLMRNYFIEAGGTEMKGVTPEQFVELLRKSREYWRNKMTMQ
jgi:hypothetical protein